MSKENKRPAWTQSIDGYPQAVAVMEDPGLVAVGSIEGPIHLYEADTGRLVIRHAGHPAGLVSMAAMPGAGGLASGGEDATIHVWSPEAAHPVESIPAPGGWVESLAAGAEGVLAAGSGRMLRLWERDRRRPAFEEELAAVVHHLQLLKGGRVLLVVTQEEIRLFDREDPLGDVRHELGATPLALRVSPDGAWLALGAADMGIRLYSLNGDAVEPLGIGPFRYKPRCFDWSPRSGHLALANGEQVCLVDRAQLVELSGREGDPGERATSALQPLRSVIGKATALRFHPRALMVAIGTAQGHLVIEDLGEGRRVLDTFVDGGELAQLAWSPGGRTLVAAMEDGAVAGFAL